MQKINPLTQKELKELLDYDPNTGIFTWKTPTSKRIKKGTRAGNDSHGTISITINKKHYRANRLAWLYMTGEWPTNDIKAVNGISDDIRWANLKLGTRKRT